MTTLKTFRLRTYKNLQILEDRRAKQSSRPDLRLLNEIEDHETALALIDEALETSLTPQDLAELKEALRDLVIASNVEQLDVDQITFETPRLTYEPEMIEIPAGHFLMGSHSGQDIPEEETPQHEVNLPAYTIGKFPITNREYAEFVKQNRLESLEKGYVPLKAGWQGRRTKTPPVDKLDHPVVGINWFAAVAYCRWLSRRTGRLYRLPTEAEWEKAASWAETPDSGGAQGEKRQYPWGDAWDTARCNTHNDQTTPVTAHPDGASAYGCYDLTGNVQEWTSTLWGTDIRVSDFPYPYQMDDGREDLDGPHRSYRIHRGGSFIDAASNLRCTARNKYDPDGKSSRRGFRVVQDL